MFRHIDRLLTATALSVLVSGCHGMNPFAADIGRTTVAGRVARAPYLSQFNYFGHIAPEPTGELVAAQKASSKGVAVYFWLPVNTPELGVRFVSGKSHGATADGKKDVVEAAFNKAGQDEQYFDPAIELQRCDSISEVSDVIEPCIAWRALGENDDSPEMPGSIEGKMTGSLVRVGAGSQDPIKALAPGLYRVNVRGAKQTTPAGPFLLQLGAPVLLEHVAMARSPEALAQSLASMRAEKAASDSLRTGKAQSHRDEEEAALPSPLEPASVETRDR